jgi:hypothetical protein
VRLFGAHLAAASQGLQGGRELSQQSQSLGQTEIVVRAVLLKADRLPVGGNRLLETAGVGESRAQVEVSPWIIALEANGLAKGKDGGFGIAAVEQNSAQIVVGFRLDRFASDRLAIGGRRCPGR